MLDALVRFFRWAVELFRPPPPPPPAPTLPPPAMPPRSRIREIDRRTDERIAKSRPTWADVEALEKEVDDL